MSTLPNTNGIDSAEERYERCVRWYNVSSDQILERYFDAHAGESRAELLARREQIIARTAELEGYARRSQAQADELDGLIAEQIAVDDLIKQGRRRDPPVQDRGDHPDRAGPGEPGTAGRRARGPRVRARKARHAA